jgi:hypothetical protein
VIRFTSHDGAHHPMIGAPRRVPGRGMGLATPVPAGHRPWKFVDIDSHAPSGVAKAP